MAKKRSASKRSVLNQPVPQWVAYVILVALFLMAIKLVKLVSGYSDIYWQ